MQKKKEKRREEKSKNILWAINDGQYMASEDIVTQMDEDLSRKSLTFRCTNI